MVRIHSKQLNQGMQQPWWEKEEKERLTKALVESLSSKDDDNQDGKQIPIIIAIYSENKAF